MPRVSVLMSVYNSERYLAEAIESILGQTFADFEFILVDDGSTDRSGEILHSYRDERIVLLRNESNIGLTRSLNRGLQLTRGEYIVRLDADDVALPERLERQVEYLDLHPEVGVVGSAVTYMDPEGRELGTQRVPTHQIHQALLNTEFCWWHSTTAFRSACLETVGTYREQFRYAQDYDLWLRIAEAYDLASLSEPLVKLRLRPESISVANRQEQQAYVKLAVELARERASEGQDALHAASGDPGTRAAVAPPELAASELAAVHLRVACLNYLLGNTADAKEALSRAIQTDPILLQQGDRLLRRLVYYGFTHATTPTARAEGRQFVSRVFANLPATVESLMVSQRKAVGYLYAVSAFESHEMRRRRQVLREVPLAVIHDPTWATDRGVWSILVKALIGGEDTGQDDNRPVWA